MNSIVCRKAASGRLCAGDVGIRMAVMFGFVTLKNGIAAVSNRIFETRLYNGFLAEKARQMEISQIAAEEKNQFIVNGQLWSALILIRRSRLASISSHMVIKY